MFSSAPVCFLDDHCLGLCVSSGGGQHVGPVVLGPGGAVVEEGELPQKQGWVLRSEWRNWETECIFILGMWGE